MSLCRALVVLALTLLSAQALAQSATEEAPEEAQPEATAQEETAPEASETEEEAREREEDERELAEIEGRILPPSPHTVPQPEDPDPELTEDFQLPPPEPEWRLRAGVGATASTSGTDVLALRLTQEIEWMPAAAAPFLFGLSGGEMIGQSYNVYRAGARLGGYARFCEDRLVTCSGAVAIRIGATFGAGSTQFDLGGEADARFRFDGVELTVRVGFFVVSSITFIDAVGLLGAAF